MKKGLLLFVLVFTLMGCGETKSTEIESSVELKESEEKQESAQKFEMTEDADKFLQRMCFCLPDFSGDEDMDEEFWHQFLFYSYTGQTGFYYKDGYYYIGVSDAPWQHYEYQGCSETADGTITAEYALYYADNPAPSASIFFTLTAFDNENGFVVIKKETEENLFQEYDMGSWSDFAEHVANLNGIYSIDRQLELFAMQTAVWASEVEYANEEYCFTVAELDNDGKLDLIVSNCGGTGWFTYSHFYEIDEHGKVRELESDFVEGDSQPDLIDDEMTVYSTFSAEGMCQYFITGDYMKVSPREYYADVRALSMKDDKVEQILLAMEREIYDEDGHGTIMWLDADGNEISAEKYQNAAADYFVPLGYEKKTATFAWKDVAALQGLAEKEIVQLLKESYEGFSVQ